jgi:hypothetical protein
MHHAHYRMAAPPPADVVVRWTARFWSAATIAFVIAFIIGEGINPSGLHEWIGLIFFPFGVCAGMLIAWRNEATGGMITVICLLVFYAVSLVSTGRLPAGWGFPVFAAPGFLFLLAWALSPPHAPAP